MTWTRFDDSMLYNPKVIQLCPGALALYVCSIIASNRDLSDGRVERFVLMKCCPGITAVMFSRWSTLLVRVGLWEVNGDGFVIHDYHEYQPSKAEVIATREAARVRKAKQRVTQGQQRDTKPGHSGTEGDVTRPHPIPSRNTYRESESKGLEVLNGEVSLTQKSTNQEMVERILEAHRKGRII